MNYKDTFDFIIRTIGNDPNNCKTTKMKDNFGIVCDALSVVRYYYGLFHNLERNSEEIVFDNYDNEEWRPVVGFEGLYEVSNMIRIRNAKTVKVLKQYEKKGYNRITLKKNKKQYSLRMSRLVAAAFIPNPENKPFVDHISANSRDDRPENLRWVTHSENMNNAQTKTNMTSSHGEAVLQYTKDGYFVNEYDSPFAAARENGWASSSGIRDCCKKNGKSKICKGFMWKFKFDVPEEQRYIKQTDVDYYTIRKNSIPIVQFTLNGEFVREWHSAQHAMRELGISGIRKCCKGECKQAGGYIWKNKNDVTLNIKDLDKK